jgi:preprotein translocase subunit SecD
VLNRYPLWKYIMLVVVILVGLLYALPNLYGEDPAVQITGARGVAASEQTLIQVQKTLQEEKITAKSVALEEGAILARFDTTDTQLRAREALMGVLGDKYVVALNLAPATPRWLAAMNAEPMKLGLDLRGGVHFLMEVDMDTALANCRNRISTACAAICVIKASLTPPCVKKITTA